MSTIRLENVTKTYSRLPFVAQSARVGRQFTSGADRAYADRVMAQSSAERASRLSQEGPIVALDGVDLTVPDGQVLAVVGPSGCGKSTLLRVVAGLTEYSGQVYYDDQSMDDVPPKDRYIGMVFQNYALYPHFKGKGNLAFFFRIHKAPDAETEERIRITSEMMGIGFKELLQRKPGTLSGGQQQRVAIARALVRYPRLFLLDEPLSNLDAQLRAQTRVEIKRLLQRFHITTLYVTHDQVEATALGDQVAVMRDGRIEQVSTYRELQHDPANVFVAGFIGRPPMSLFPGTVQEGAVHVDEASIPLPAAVQRQVKAGQTLVVGIRPEATHLVLPNAPSAAGCRLRATVDAVEPDFAHRTLTAYLHKGESSLAAHGSLETGLNTGDRVEVLLPFENLYFFDGASGARLRG